MLMADGGISSDLEDGCLRSLVIFFLVTASVGFVVWEFVLT